ncbi:hypothetical protein GH714_031448 [Hevea brasiliensis]|uniref:Pentacotripeptide-repeat region of PRORP domain-containing protein n=1 Tax=Hevea brasiliensis TaxID=3981 RepID=A0A6A6L1B9_HEVBR|nr:hypothetical protein GH714_031448 [Hevea brasiliensis]
MLDIFGEAGRIASMNHVFKQMQEKGIKIDAVTYTSLMHWVSSSGDVDGAVKIWKEMKENGCYPTVVSYTAYMKVLFDNKRVKEATDVYKEMLKSGIAPNCHTYTVLMEYLVLAGKYQEALEIFNKMQEAGVQPDKAEALKTLRISGESDTLLRQVNPHFATESINNEDAPVIITSADDDPLNRGLLLILLKKQNLVAVDHLLAGVIDKSILLDSWIVSTIIEEMIRAGHSLGLYLGCLLIYRLGSARRPTCAAKIFNLLPDEQKCTATYTAMVGVYFSAGSTEKALNIYKTMKKKGINSSLGTYNVLLSGLERSGSIYETETYRKEKSRLMADVYSWNSVPMEEKICDLLFAGGLAC